MNTAQREALGALAKRHAQFLRNTKDRFEDVAFSAFTRRSRYPNLLAVVGDSAADVEQQLRTFADGQVEPTILTTTIAYHKKPKLAFLFSGQDGRWARMGLGLMRREEVFRETVEQIDEVFRELAGWSLLAELRREASESRIHDTVVVQPAVMAIQVALVRLYEHYGIRPSGVVGHSIGEVAAAFASGALTLEQAVQVIYHRSQAQDRVSGKGGMLAVGLSQEEAGEWIEGLLGVCIAAVNGPEMLTLSGDHEPLERLAKRLESRGIFNRPVRVQVAYHSHHMEPIRGRMLESLADSQGVTAATPLYSTVTGRRENGGHLNADYWYRNVRQPVLFTDALGAMLDDRFDTFVEIGPHPVLVRGGQALVGKRDCDAILVPAMTRREPEVTVFLQSLARLATRGLEPDAEKLFGPCRRFVRLPSNPWQHESHWFEPPETAELRRGRFAHPFLKRQTAMVSEAGLAVWEAAIDVNKFPYLRDHQVDGEIVFPATGHLELAWAVASEQFRHESFSLEHVRFDSPLILPGNSRHPLEVRLEVISGEGDYRICSRPAGETGESQWSNHSSGRIDTSHDRFEQTRLPLDEIGGRFGDDDEFDVRAFYETIAKAGLAYGEMFRCIRAVKHRDHEMLAQVRLPNELANESKRNVIHPALLDACLHVVFADVHRNGNPNRIFLPHRIERVRFYCQPPQKGPNKTGTGTLAASDIAEFRGETREPVPVLLGPESVWVHVQGTRNDEHVLHWDTTIYDENGELVAEVLGVIGKRLSGAGASQTDTLYEGCYEYGWVPTPRETENCGRNFDFTKAVLFVSGSQGPEAQAVIASVAAHLDREEVHSVVLSTPSEDSYEEVLADIPLDRRTLIVFAAGLSAAHTGWRGLAAAPSIPSLLKLAQVLHRREGVPRFCVVTNGAAGVAGDEPLDLSQATLHGMARVINNECPNIPLTVIDLSARIDPHEVDALLSDLTDAVREARQLYEACVEMGDDKLSRFAVDVWSRASGGQVPADVVQRELQKGRNDVWATALALPAEAVRRVRQDELDEAVEYLTQAYDMCRDTGMNAWMGPIQALVGDDLSAAVGTCGGHRSSSAAPIAERRRAGGAAGIDGGAKISNRLAARIARGGACCGDARFDAAGAAVLGRKSHGGEAARGSVRTCPDFAGQGACGQRSRLAGSRGRPEDGPPETA